MRHFIRLLFIILLLSFLNILFSCGGDDDSNMDVPSLSDIKAGYLINKQGGWSVISVNVPYGGATIPEDWVDFKVTFTKNNITVRGYPAWAENVWPESNWLLGEDVNSIIRLVDDVEMSIDKLTETELQVRFMIPEGVNTNGRILVLSGEYFFSFN